MGKPSSTQQQLIFLFLTGVFVGSSIILFFEMFPIERDTLSLPEPDLEGHLPLSQAIQESKQTMDLNNFPIELDYISQILWAFQGKSHRLDFRTAPSAGATYPLEIFFIHTGTSTLNKGFYHYNPQQHRLTNVSATFNKTMLLSALTGENREAVSNVSTIFFILAEYSRTTTRYGNRGIQYVHLEVGHAIQNFLLQIVSLNLYSKVISGFNSNVIQNFLDTLLEPMVILPIGSNSELNSSLFRYKEVNIGDSSEITVEQAIAARKSVRDYQSGEIPLSVLLNVIKNSTQFPYVIGNSSFLDIRLIIGEVNGLLSGSYQFFIENYSLKQLSQGDLRHSLRLAGVNQSWIETAQLDIVISVNSGWIDQQSDPTLYHRMMMYNIGMMAQNIYLKCAALRLGTVVIGALYEGSTSDVIDLPDSYIPIYIMPIGLTPEFFQESTDFYLPLTETAKNMGLLVYVFFYFSLYLSLPMFRRRMKKRMRWIHCIVGIIPPLGVLFHFMIIHGHVRDLVEFIQIGPYFNALIFLIIDLLSFPATRDELGKLLAELASFFSIIAFISGFLIAFKLIKGRKRMRQMHKYSIFITITLAIIHTYLNGTFFANQPMVFLLLNVLSLDLYFLLKISPDVIKSFKEDQVISN
ncbi:MAG: SagB family peptide dehydrogenase [Candidatus Hodarchaeales archaeon]